MIGGTAEYVALISSVVPGETWLSIAGDMPLAMGLQLRNVALSQRNVRIIPPGVGAVADAREILGDHLAEWYD